MNIRKHCLLALASFALVGCGSAQAFTVPRSSQTGLTSVTPSSVDPSGSPAASTESPAQTSGSVSSQPASSTAPASSSVPSGSTSSATSQVTTSASSQQSSASSQSSRPSSSQSSQSSQSTSPDIPAPVDPAEVDYWSLVTSASDLQVGDMIMIAEAENGDVALKDIENNNGKTAYWLPVAPGTFSGTNLTEWPASAAMLTLGKNNGKWTLANEDGALLGATAAKKLSWERGTSTWNISISSKGEATIANTNSSYGTLYYNYNNGNPRFTTYTTTKGMTAPQIYRAVTVEKVYPTSIGISGSNEVSRGRTTQLSITLSPGEANVKTATWSSDDASVATVDSNGRVKGIALGSTTIRAKGYSAPGVKDLDAEFHITVTEPEVAKWTILEYVCGSDLESDSRQGGCASADIQEMVSAKNKPNDVNIVIETGGASSWAKSDLGIEDDEIGRFHVENNKLVNDDRLDEASMGAQSTFASFLNWGLSTYPAEKVGVILWNHGGALDGVCYDEVYEDYLQCSESSAAFESVFSDLGITGKLEFIGYDACLMQVQDIAERNADFFNYMVASEESESSDGWDYSWLEDLYAYKSTPVILKSICDKFVASQEDPVYDNDQCLSYLDLSKMPAYKTAIENLAADLEAKGEWDTLKEVLLSAKSYGGDWYYEDEYYEATDPLGDGYPEEWFTPEEEDGETYYHLNGVYMFGTLDAKDVFTKIKANAKLTSDKVDAALAALEDVVGYSKAGAEAGETHGLALVVLIDDTLARYPASETRLTGWRGLSAHLSTKLK